MRRHGLVHCQPQPGTLPVISIDHAPFMRVDIAQDELEQPTDDECDIDAQIEDEVEIRNILLKTNCRKPKRKT